MQATRALAALMTIAAIGLCSGGCTKPAADGPGAKATKHDDHDHEHEHAHAGPHQGHLMVIGDEEYHAEWTHDASGKVTFYILDAAGKSEVPITADHLTIDVKIGDNPPKSYDLLAVAPKDGKSATFEITDKQFAALFDQLKSSGLVLTLHADIADKHFSQIIKEHDHGHDH